MEQTTETYPNHLIALFDGAKVTIEENSPVYGFSPEKRDSGTSSINLASYEYLRYDTSWDWLMPVARKFDTLDTDFHGSREVYERYCDEIDGAVVRYDIKEAHSILVKAIEWFNDYQDITKKSMVGAVKPPIGIKPEFIWKGQRLKALTEAILRYTHSDNIIPIEWIEERNSLIDYFNNRKKKDEEKLG